MLNRLRNLSSRFEDVKDLPEKLFYKACLLTTDVLKFGLKTLIEYKNLDTNPGATRINNLISALSYRHDSNHDDDYTRHPNVSRLLHLMRENTKRMQSEGKTGLINRNRNFRIDTPSRFLNPVEIDKINDSGLEFLKQAFGEDLDIKTLLARLETAKKQHINSSLVQESPPSLSQSEVILEVEEPLKVTRPKRRNTEKIRGTEEVKKDKEIILI